jgi:shikimate dehydrogenase/3-dehydroquinate dehydratase type I
VRRLSTARPGELPARALARRRLLEALPADGSPRPLASLTPSERRLVRPLAEMGCVEVVDEIAEAAPLAQPLADEPEAPPHPTPGQAAVLEQIAPALAEGGFNPFLLFGATGSGKTEIYLRASREVLDRGRGVLWLVPEIGLTPLLVSKVSRRFPGAVALLHSGLSKRERYRTWTDVRDGRCRLVVGTRSALFAPVRDLGLIIVDEEQDGSYKQAESPRYNARDLAVVRAQAERAVLVMGSATPSMETFRHAQAGRYGLLRLGGRILSRPLPTVRFVDMRREFGRSGEVRPVSEELAEELRACMARGDQALVMRNRRGWAAAVFCPTCGGRVICANCSVTMTWHRSAARLRCHYCASAEAFPESCPTCGAEELKLLGEGTERIEDILAEAVPEATIVRMDRDTVRGRGAHERLLRRFDRGEIDILVGTQMIAKGHDFPRVTLVGVLSAAVDPGRGPGRTRRAARHRAGPGLRAGSSAVAPGGAPGLRGVLRRRESLPARSALPPLLGSRAVDRVRSGGFSSTPVGGTAGPGAPPGRAGAADRQRSGACTLGTPTGQVAPADPRANGGSATLDRRGRAFPSGGGRRDPAPRAPRRRRPLLVAVSSMTFHEQPVVVCSILEPDAASTERALGRVSEDVGLVEIRADLLSTEQIERVVRGSSRSVVVTVRHERDGGRFTGSEIERRALVERGLEAGARFVDVEWGGSLADLADGPSSQRVILSHHGSRCRLQELRSLHRAMEATRAARLKIVPDARKPGEILAVRDLLASTEPRGRLACFAAGRAGALSRLLAPAGGSWATYGSLRPGAETAPGQFTAHDLHAVYDVRGIGNSTELRALIGEAVFGSPSPAMHAAAYREAALDARYFPLELSELEDLLPLLGQDGLDFRALAVTMPFKRSACGMCARLDEVSRTAGAVNTVLLADGRWSGFNTDGPAVLALVRARGEPRGARVAVVGAGGTARAAAAVLAGAGSRVRIFNRTLQTARVAATAVGAVASPLDELPSAEWDILVQATPLGARGERVLEHARLRGRLVIDAVYGSTTPLVRDARERGIESVGGYELLVAQAVLQFNRMTGVKISENVMRRAGAAWLGARHP